MMYKNSAKILFSNFNLVWKTLLYFLVTLLITLGLAYATALPIINVLIKAGVFSSISKSFNSFFHNFNFTEIFKAISDIVKVGLDAILENANKLILPIILFIFVVFILRKFLTGFHKLTNSNSLYHFMSSNIKYGFSSSLVSNIRKNMKMQGAYFITEFPIDIIIVAISALVLRSFELGSVMAVLTPILFVFVFIVLKSLKVTIFSGWVPAVITFNCGVFTGLKKGFRATNRRFMKVFSTSILIGISALFINLFVGVFTFGIGLFVTLPMTFVFIDIFKMVMFFGSQGMRFYADANNVIVPKSLEETEKLKNIKFVV